MELNVTNRAPPADGQVLTSMTPRQGIHARDGHGVVTEEEHARTTSSRWAIHRAEKAAAPWSALAPPGWGSSEAVAYTRAAGTAERRRWIGGRSCAPLNS